MDLWWAERANVSYTLSHKSLQSTNNIEINKTPTQVKPMHAIAPDSISAQIAGYELAVGK